MYEILIDSVIILTAISPQSMEKTMYIKMFIVVVFK